MSRNNMSRRDFAATAATTLFLSSAILGREGHAAPNDKLNIAAIGIGGMGASNLHDSKDENIVALADVDWGYAAKVFDRYEKAKRFKDYRKMLEEIDKEIDAVIVATPDHTHAVVGMKVLKHKKHLFCQKPLAHSIWETRMLTEAAREAKVQTQMGNQGHSSNESRMLCEWIEDGVIGNIRQIYAWSDRPVGGDPWSSFLVESRPKDTPPVPSELDWDMWLGPAQYRPYHPHYVPLLWRSWLDFGTGAIGDMGCHIMDPAFWALKLGYPEYVEATTTHWEADVTKETYPRAAIVNYHFPARDAMPPVVLTWTDGRLLPPIPDVMYKQGEKFDTNGALYIGEKGLIIHGSHGAGGLHLLPDSLMKDYKRPEEKIPRVKGSQGGHVQDWIRACKDGKPSSSSFEYGGALTEMVLLGVLAMRVKDQRLYFDPKTMEVKGNEAANKIIKPTFREGWTL